MQNMWLIYKGAVLFVHFEYLKYFRKKSIFIYQKCQHCIFNNAQADVSEVFWQLCEILDSYPFTLCIEMKRFVFVRLEFI